MYRTIATIQPAAVYHAEPDERTLQVLAERRARPADPEPADDGFRMSRNVFELWTEEVEREDQIYRAPMRLRIDDVIRLLPPGPVGIPALPMMEDGHRTPAVLEAQRLAYATFKRLGGLSATARELGVCVNTTRKRIVSYRRNLSISLGLPVSRTLEEAGSGVLVTRNELAWKRAKTKKAIG